MIRTYSEHIIKLSKTKFVKWYNSHFTDGLAKQEYERLHNDGNGVSQEDTDGQEPSGEPSSGESTS